MTCYAAVTDAKLRQMDDPEAKAELVRRGLAPDPVAEERTRARLRGRVWREIVIEPERSFL